MLANGGYSHLLGDARLLRVDDDDIAPPKSRETRAPTDRALVAFLDDFPALPARLSLACHSNLLLSFFSCRLRGLLLRLFFFPCLLGLTLLGGPSLDPFLFSQAVLPHRQTDFRRGKRALQAHRDNPRRDVVALQQLPSRLLSNEARELRVIIDVVIHDLADVNQPLDGANPRKRTELRHFRDIAVHDLVDFRLVHQQLHDRRIIGRAIPWHPPSLSRALDFRDHDHQAKILVHQALILLLNELQNRFLEVRPELRRRHPNRVRDRIHRVHSLHPFTNGFHQFVLPNEYNPFLEPRLQGPVIGRHPAPIQPQPNQGIVGVCRVDPNNLDLIRLQLHFREVHEFFHGFPLSPEQSKLPFHLRGNNELHPAQQPADFPAGVYLLFHRPHQEIGVQRHPHRFHGFIGRRRRRPTSTAAAPSC